MSLNELNIVENYLIKQLTGVNLNTSAVSEETALYNGFWHYKLPQDLQRQAIQCIFERT